MLTNNRFFRAAVRARADGMCKSTCKNIPTFRRQLGAAILWCSCKPVRTASVLNFRSKKCVSVDFLVELHEKIGFSCFLLRAFSRH
jgi:hypothetical protein